MKALLSLLDIICTPLCSGTCGASRAMTFATSASHGHHVSATSTQDQGAQHTWHQALRHMASVGDGATRRNGLAQHPGRQTPNAQRLGQRASMPATL
jgi:hypothetical protein